MCATQVFEDRRDAGKAADCRPLAQPVNGAA